MAKAGKVRQLKYACKKRHANPSHKVEKDIYKKKHCKASSVEKGWEDVTCSVCMESPHNAVLLLCSSYGKGCRPYMCATSYRFSNCLDQYKKAYTKSTSLQGAQPSGEAVQVPQLSCPICRGQVKGWTVVEQARKDLNKQMRSCMQENCSFVGDYKQLRKHVKATHPLSRPRDVDPALEEKWVTLERERERNDVISAITSSDPSAVVFGDFVIEGNQNPPFYINYENVGGFLDDNYFRINSRSFGGRLGFISDVRIGRHRTFFDDANIPVPHGAPAADLNSDALPVNNRDRQLLIGRINPRTRDAES